MQNFNYPFCPNQTNSYHSCGEYCIQRYWPGNHPFRFKFCPLIKERAEHRCSQSCIKYLPNLKTVKLPLNFYPHIKDPQTRMLTFCLMYYGYN